MARKSMVKDIRGIFENDSNKSPTMKHCDEKFQYTKGNKNEDNLNNKRLYKTVSRGFSHKYPGKEQSGMSNYKTNVSHYGTLREKIVKFNTESPTPKASTSTVPKKEHLYTNTVSQRTFKNNDLVVTAKNNNQISNDKMKSKFNKNNFENMTSDNQTSFQSLKNNVDVNAGNTKKETDAPITKNFTKKVKETNTNELMNKVNVNKIGPTIAPKPKYFNKIKPHPDMPPKAKNQLLEKIKIFNDLSDNEFKSTRQTGLSNITTECSSKHEKSMLSPKKILVNKPVTPARDRSEENLYDIIQNSKTQINLRPPPKGNLKKTTCSNNISKELKSISRKNSDEHLYDVIENSNLNNKAFRNVLKSNSNENEYDIVVNTNAPKTVKDARLIQGRSLEVLEDDGYVVIEGIGRCNEKDEIYENVESDTSSEEELATEYDVIENLNVTKITVERRYKIHDNEVEDSTFNIKRETYYDHNLNPRIERISRGTQRNAENSNHCGNTCIKKSLLIVQELLQSELAYFKGLLRVYEDYIVYFKENPHLCTPSIWKVFGNFEEIYRRQIEFYAELTECNNNVDAIAETFLKNESLFNIYEQYIINRYASTKHLMGECRLVIQTRDKELDNKLNLDCYLLTPFQRLLRYLLLLKNLTEALEKENTPSDKLNHAVSYLENFIEGTNIHAKVVQDIQNSPIDLIGRGKLLMIDDCFVRNNGKKYRSTVILFQSIIIFTRKTESQTYIFKNCIYLSDLYIRSISEDLTSFQLQNFTEYRHKQDNKYVFDVEVSDPKSKQEWVKKIETLLWNQFAAHKQS